MILWKHQYVSRFGKLRSGKDQFSFQSQRRTMPKNIQTTIQWCSFHMLARGFLKSFKIVQQYVNWELSDVQEKAEEPEIKLPTSAGSWKKQESSRKTSVSAVLTMPKPLTVWSTTNCKILKEMGITDYLICLLRNLYAGQESTVRTRHGTKDWFQIGKGVYQGVYCHPAYLTYMQRISCEMLGWMNHKLESRLLGEISIASDMQMVL